MSTRARAWLATRATETPQALMARMDEAVAEPGAADSDEQASVHRDLADAALLCVRAATERGDDRSAALHLLAADALITAACEAAAEVGVDALSALCRGVSPASLVRVVPLPPVLAGEEPRP